MARGAGDLAGGTVSPVMTDAQFNRWPGPGRWSIAEYLLHLNVGADAFTHQIEIATDR